MWSVAKAFFMASAGVKDSLRSTLGQKAIFTKAKLNASFKLKLPILKLLLKFNWIRVDRLSQHVNSIIIINPKLQSSSAHVKSSALFDPGLRLNHVMNKSVPS